MEEKIKSFLGNKDHLGRRYCIFLLGLLICSFGVACTTKAGLGTSPVAAIPFTLSLIFPKLSFGNWLIIFCMAQIIAQIVMLRKRTVIPEIVIQIILSFAYGYLTDFSLFLLKGLEMNSYPVQLVFLLLGCIVLAFGVYLELLGDVGMLSGDAFIKAIAIVTEKDYGNVKVVTDVSMSVISAVIALITLRKLVGVREGTVIAALIVGIIIKFFQKKFKPVADKILPFEKPTEKPTQKPTQPPSKSKTVDVKYAVSACIEYGKQLGMNYDSSLNTSNASWFSPTNASYYDSTSDLTADLKNDVEYVAFYYQSDGIVPSDLSFNIISENNKIYVVYC